MFKSIEYLRYDEITNCFIYKLIDTDFECDIAVLVSHLVNVVPRENVAQIVAIITEYEKRNYSYKEIIQNLFKYILLFSDTYKFVSFKECLEWQKIYLDEDFKHLNFNGKYYKGIINKWDKHKAFI